MDDVIVLDTDRKFNTSQWIGTGKIYKDVPIEVSDAFTDVSKLPKTLRATLPNPAMSVTDFLAVKLPGVLDTFEKSVGQIHDWFSTDSPNCDPIPALWALKSIPPSFFVAELVHGLPQQWLNGAKSIRDPRQPSLRLPLFALRFFVQIQELHQAQEKWDTSVAWVRDDLGHDTAIFSTVSWNATHSGAPDGQLDWTRLVDDEWLSDSIIHAMMADLQSRVADSPELAAAVTVAPLSFQRAIVAAATHENPSEYSVKLLEEYKRSVDEGKSKIYFPLHVNGNHWIAFMIDFVKRVFGFGDSMGRKGAARKFIPHLQQWLRRSFSGTFQDLGDVLPHAQQKDFVHCGVYTTDCIQHEVFKTPLISYSDCRRVRMEWFQRFVATAANPPRGKDYLASEAAKGEAELEAIDKELDANPETSVAGRMLIANLLNPAPPQLLAPQPIPTFLPYGGGPILRHTLVEQRAKVVPVGPGIHSISAGDNGWELWRAISADPAALGILHLDGAEEYSDDGEPDYEEPEEGSKKRRPKPPRGAPAGAKRQKVAAKRTRKPAAIKRAAGPLKRVSAGKGKSGGRGGRK
ncbi:hypothetical protein C8R46DRAFT_1219524 [Mycena filopes]|nr:hypothetical protein C8R46DRAFT_1219524 [Mycena filopes]